MKMPAFLNRNGVGTGPGDGRNVGKRLVIALLLTAAVTAYGAGIGAGPKIHQVIIEAMTFKPDVVQAKVGDTIVWTNKDPFPHTATNDKNGLHSPDIAPGASWKFKAKTEGEFSYICTAHPTMKGKIHVTRE
ncbi:MAG TPA: cupredoxin family copper-binding protein [Herbaspirillum sp.]|jgi:plastocyanin